MDRWTKLAMCCGFIGVAAMAYAALVPMLPEMEPEPAAPWHRCPDQDVLNMHAWCNDKGSMVLPQAGTTLFVDGQLLQ